MFPAREMCEILKSWKRIFTVVIPHQDILTCEMWKLWALRKLHGLRPLKLHFGSLSAFLKILIAQRRLQLSCFCHLKRRCMYFSFDWQGMRTTIQRRQPSNPCLSSVWKTSRIRPGTRHWKLAYLPSKWTSSTPPFTTWWCWWRKHYEPWLTTKQTQLL